MILRLSCVGAHPLLPNVVPGTQLAINLAGPELTVAATANAILLHNLIAALNDGALVEESPRPLPEDVVTALRSHLAARMAPAPMPYRRAG